MVYVAHDQVEAMTMAGRVVVMRAGVVEWAADPITLYERPANMFVASFMGAPSMNFLQGAIEEGPGGPVFRTRTGLCLPLDGRPDVLRRRGRELVLGIRPEDAGAAGTGRPELPLDMGDVEPPGPHTLAIGKVGGEPFVAQMPPALRMGPGDRVPVALDPPAMHFLKAETGAVVGPD